jgi:hypothetical protein
MVKKFIFLARLHLMNHFFLRVKRKAGQVTARKKSYDGNRQGVLTPQVHSIAHSRIQVLLGRVEG